MASAIGALRDTICQLKPETVAKINHVIVRAGQQLHGEASQSVRADSLVVETESTIQPKDALESRYSNCDKQVFTNSQFFLANRPAV